MKLNNETKFGYLDKEGNFSIKNFLDQETFECYLNLDHLPVVFMPIENMDYKAFEKYAYELLQKAVNKLNNRIVER